ncbi:hypothetical protein [Paenarthrobacter sp. NPDC058040]|uniref:hypothetical protein n=1 Tax=unclassified Paenarthrobacter TaxID=2634190 RepID=UPI0036DDAF45
MLMFDVMSQKTKFTVAVIANVLTVLLALSCVPMIPSMMDAGAPLWLIVLPLVLTIIFATVSGWLWRKARD